jgi:hypothetical protein
MATFPLHTYQSENELSSAVSSAYTLPVLAVPIGHSGTREADALGEWNLSQFTDKLIPTVGPLGTVEESSGYLLSPAHVLMMRRGISGALREVYHRINFLMFDMCISSDADTEQTSARFIDTDDPEQRTRLGVAVLEEFYDFRNVSETVKFVGDNWDLLPVLLEAFKQIEKRFPQSRCVLELVFDMEGASTPGLMLYISTEAPVEAAYEALEALDDEWWLDVDPAVSSRVCIDLELM